MTLDIAVWLLLVVAIILSNIPWIFEHKLFLFVSTPNKSVLISIGEWFLYFVLTGILAYLLENKAMGHVQDQGWEFYTITFFMFAIFAFPGFIYRFNLKFFLEKSKTKA